MGGCTCVDSDAVAFGGGEDFGGDDVSHDDVALPAEVETNAVKGCEVVLGYRSLHDHPGGNTRENNLLAPGSPTMVLLLPMRTSVSPEMTPDTTMTLGVESFSFTAAVNSARVDTVVTVPPEPPFVPPFCVA